MNPDAVLYYPHDYTDEVVPCDCTLEGWAAWFAAPDPEWNRPEAAKPGETFLAQTAHLVIIDCVRNVGRWEWPIELEERLAGEKTAFYLCHGKGLGWSADNSGGTVAEALAWAEDVETGDVAYVAAMTWAGEVELTFELTDEGPALRVAQVGRA